MIKATSELMARFDKELEFEIPKHYPDLEDMWIMKGKPDPNNGKEYYWAYSKDSLAKGYERVQQQK